MSEKLSWIAIRASKSDAQARFGIRDSKTSPDHQDYPTRDYCGVEVATGWYVLVVRNTDYFYGLGPEDWQRLSNGDEVIAGRINEQSNEAETKCIRGGEVLWQIDYSMQRSDDEEFKLSGPLPECYARIESKYRRLQAEKGDMDYLFSIPVEVCGRITGYCYDDDNHEYVQVEATGEASILHEESGRAWVFYGLLVIAGLLAVGLILLLLWFFGVLASWVSNFIITFVASHLPQPYKPFVFAMSGTFVFVLFALFVTIATVPMSKWLDRPFTPPRKNG